MFQRNALGYMREWRKKAHRKPLVLRGARQVGKTTVTESFAKEYPYYVSLNLEKEADRMLFDPTMDIKRTVENISYNRHTPLNENTLLFIDEIQNSATAVQSLRYFYEQYPKLSVVAAGSLLENYTDRKFSFPVGRVEYLAMRPCTFYEYLSATGDMEDLQLLLENKGHFIHDRLMQAFNRYTLLGGMPEVIQTYIDTDNLRATEPIYASLLASYSDDVEKYAVSRTQAAVIRHILQYGWSQAGEIITYERFAGSNYKSREVSEAFLTLQKSMLLETVYPTTSVELPALPVMSHHPKLLWIDTGLVNYSTGIRDELFNAKDIQDVYRGRIAEHIVGQELAGQSVRTDFRRWFWQKSGKSEAEVDYLYAADGKLIPIEVKSGVNARLKSLQQFMSQAPHNIAMRIWSKQFKVDDAINPISGKAFRLINLPFYMTGMIDKVLQQTV